MATLSTLRTTLQTFLKDTDAKKWTADDLDSFIGLAVTQWTTDVPIASSNSYTVVSGQHEYDLPENAVEVRGVYGYFESSGTQEYLAPMHIRPGAWSLNDEPRRYVVGFPTETQFYLPREPRGSSFILYYGACHNPLSLDTDTLSLRMHRWGELAVIYYAAHLAFLPYSASRARLEQWARKQDLNVGNPLMEESQRYRELYQSLIDEHTEPAIYEFVRLERV
jgi:hypothetical protein